MFFEELICDLSQHRIGLSRAPQQADSCEPPMFSYPSTLLIRRSKFLIVSYLQRELKSLLSLLWLQRQKPRFPPGPGTWRARNRNDFLGAILNQNDHLRVNSKYLGQSLFLRSLKNCLETIHPALRSCTSSCLAQFVLSSLSKD